MGDKKKQGNFPDLISDFETFRSAPQPDVFKTLHDITSESNQKKFVGDPASQIETGLESAKANPFSTRQQLPAILAPLAAPKVDVHPDASLDPNAPLPGSFEGHPENLAGYVEEGPVKMGRGLVKYAATARTPSEMMSGASDVLEGLGETATPLLPFALAGAPATTLATLPASHYAGKGAEELTKLATDNPEAIRLAGNLGAAAPAMIGAKEGITRAGENTGYGIEVGPVGATVTKTPKEFTARARVGKTGAEFKVPRTQELTPSPRETEFAARSGMSPMQVTPLDQQIAATHNSTGGASFSINGTNHVGRRVYAVSLFPDRSVQISGRNVTPQDIAAFREANHDVLSRPNMTIGTWHDPETGVNWLDISGVTPNKQSAIRLGRNLNQIGIMRLDNFEFTPTEGTGAAPATLPTPDERVNALNAEIPVKKPYAGTHFSQTPVKGDALLGSRRGESGIGSERNRLQFQPTAPGGVYFYDRGTRGEPAITARGNASEVQGNYAIADIATDPEAQKIWNDAYTQTFNTLNGSKRGPFSISTVEADGAAKNAAEQALLDAGYDGYKNSALDSPVPNATFLFGDHPVNAPGMQPQVEIPKAPTKQDTGSQAMTWTLPHDLAQQAEFIAQNIPGVSVVNIPNKGVVLHAPAEVAQQVHSALSNSMLADAMGVPPETSASSSPSALQQFHQDESGTATVRVPRLNNGKTPRSRNSQETLRPSPALGNGPVPAVSERRGSVNEGASVTSPDEEASRTGSVREGEQQGQRGRSAGEVASPDKTLQTLAHGYAKRDVHHDTAPTDPRGAAIADAYDAMTHSPNDPKTKASYSALISETKAQWDYLKRHGFSMSVTDEQPYPDAKSMLDDIRNNHHISVWSGGAPPSDHPLSKIDPDTKVSYNTLFRAVHDIMGHAQNGYDFSEAGEENAFLDHSQMYSKAAIPALTTETKGQASWFFNNKGVRDGKPLGDFPEQKAALLPSKFYVRPDVASKGAQFIPSAKGPAKFLTADELKLLSNPRSMKKFIDTFMKLPSMKELGEVAKAGQVGHDWYEASQEAFKSLHATAPAYFREGDAEKWANLVGATSPHQGVAQNLREALYMWKQWNDAGRPTTPKEIMQKVKAYSLGSKKMPNAVSALIGADPFAQRKTHFKAPSFGAALGARPNAADYFVGDTHMADIAGVSPFTLKSPSTYYALAAKTRQVAHDIGMSTRGAQAAMWSFKVTLDSLADKNPDKTPSELASLVTPERITREKRDFADIMLNDSEVRSMLKELYGLNSTQLSALDEKLRAIAARPIQQGAASSASSRPLARAVKRIQQSRAARSEAKVPDDSDVSAAPASEEDTGEGEGTARVVLKNGVSANITSQKTPDGLGGIRVQAHTGRTKIGEATFYPVLTGKNAGVWYAAGAHVEASWRRLGVATALYDTVQNSGRKIVPGAMSKDAEAFWKNRSAKEEGDTTFDPADFEDFRASQRSASSSVPRGLAPLVRRRK